jgi:carboxylesterase type B
MYTTTPKDLENELNVASVTMFADPLQHIRNGLTSRVPFMVGNTQDDGSLFVVGLMNLSDFLTTSFGTLVTVDEMHALYPGLNDDNMIISQIVKDFEFLW